MHPEVVFDDNLRNAYRREKEEARAAAAAKVTEHQKWKHVDERNPK